MQPACPIDIAVFLLGRSVDDNMFPIMSTKAKAVTGKKQSFSDGLSTQGLKPVFGRVQEINASGFKRELRRQVARLNMTEEAEIIPFIEAMADWDE